MCHVVDRPGGEIAATAFMQSRGLLLVKDSTFSSTTADRPSYRGDFCSIRKKSPGPFGRRSERQGRRNRSSLRGALPRVRISPNGPTRIEHGVCVKRATVAIAYTHEHAG